MEILIIFMISEKYNYVLQWENAWNIFCVFILSNKKKKIQLNDFFKYDLTLA